MTAPSQPAEPTTPPAPTEPTAPANEPGFPPNTPWRDMRPEEQAAYWQHQARRHEGRVSALGNITPEALAELQTKAAKADDYEAENGTATEKAVRSAYTQAEQDVAGKYQPELVRARFEAAIGDRLSDDELDAVLEPLDLSKFLAADGMPDRAKIRDYADKIAPVKDDTTQQYQRRSGPSPSGQGRHGAAAGKPGDSARAALAKRGIKLAD